MSKLQKKGFKHAKWQRLGEVKKFDDQTTLWAANNTWYKDAPDDVHHSSTTPCEFNFADTYICLDGEQQKKVKDPIDQRLKMLMYKGHYDIDPESKVKTLRDPEDFRNFGEK